MAALVGDPGDEVDLWAIAGWAVRLAWVYFAVRPGRTAKLER
ncbi:hypothetical protein [Nonomuraea turcica]|nr:hypothetical protein [Nonomuraea sp. G32]MDP4510554.1 hypothetical protein [Nonomuraea sp. G32]